MAVAALTIVLLVSIWAAVCTYFYNADISQFAVTHIDRTCVPDAYTAWDDYRECITSRTGYLGNGTLDSFHRTILEQFGRRNHTLLTPLAPWHRPSACAVLLEFRPLRDRLEWSVRNAMDNLPVSWCIQVAGSSEVLEAVNASFQVEVHVDKIRLLDLGEGANVTQSSISTVLTDRAFYDQLIGDMWLFFQLDSAICKRQRHLLRDFLAKGYGWWGAPWRYSWHGWPFFCGNGGLSLRHRHFINDLLDRHARESNSTVNEDVWLCQQTMQEVGLAASEIMLGQQLRMLPASHHEAMQFSVETEMHTRPFGVHQFWFHLRPNFEMRALFESCPEALEITPKYACDDWASIICSAKLDRTILSPLTECDWSICDKILSDELQKKDVMYPL